jgi:hypothetical protein
VGLIVLSIVILADCGGSESSMGTSSVSSASPTTCSDIACSMTRPSGVQGLMLPRDATVHPGATGMGHAPVRHRPARRLYDQAVTGQGWLLVPKDSVMDPAMAALGFHYSHWYCKPGPAPVKIFSVTVGNIDGTDLSKAPTAPQADIIFTTTPPEGTCP